MIILEGVNGVGKTTYVKLLSQILNAPVYRAFKRPGSNHYGEERDRLTALGVPVNTFVDDMYLADMARILDWEVIVDRSFPSAVAYEMVEKQGTFKADWVKYASEWERLLGYSLRPVLLVRLVAPYNVAYERMTQHVPSMDEFERLDAWLDRVFELLETPKLTIDTSEMSIPDGIALIRARMGELCRQPSNSSGAG